MAAYYLSLLIFITLLGLGMILIYFMLTVKKQKKLQRIKQLSFEEKYRDSLRKTSHYQKLSTEDKYKIERSILLFIHTKEFVGVDLNVSDEMKVIIAFYACLLLLHITSTNCYDNLRTIVIYPHPMAIQKVNDNGGIFSKEQFVIQGQSANDTVIISWDEAKSQAFHLRHDNVIIHEFTHEIDFMTGEIDGVPPLERSKYDEWSRVLLKEFNTLSQIALKNRNWGKYKLLGAYAATNEAEFFAVLTERFFESPKSLQTHFPDLYKELDSFYHPKGINTSS